MKRIVCVIVFLAIGRAAVSAEGIHPQGRKLAFMGYSGDPARDLANGFTVAGPVYGNQMPYLERCFANGWPVVAHIGPRITFNDKSPDKYKLDPASLKAEVERQVRDLAGHKEIVWWAVTPEELRPWRKDEMQYLEIVCDAIRRNDPMSRPVYMYNPNHRDAASLIPIAKQVDIVAKGCYVNLAGRKRDRAWVRWGIEQEIEAIRTAGRPNAIPLLNPELCRDPEPGEEKEIRSWVRHDIYLGMACGARGVLIWSLFKRKEVRSTWQLWYDAYAECARELNGDRKLAEVFLFGARQNNLKVERKQGTVELPVGLGGNAEPETTSEKEREKRTVKLPSWTSAEFAYRDHRWLFIIHSANAPTTFTVSGRLGDKAVNAFDDTPVDLRRPLVLPAYGVVGVRMGEK